jgi:hypothetical protein
MPGPGHHGAWTHLAPPFPPSDDATRQMLPRWAYMVGADGMSELLPQGAEGKAYLQRT